MDGKQQIIVKFPLRLCNDLKKSDTVLQQELEFLKFEHRAPWPLPGITEPAGQVWPAWHCSLDYCCACQLMKSLSIFSFFPPHFLVRVAFDSSRPESADRLSSRVSVCISLCSSCWEGYKMLNHASICMKCIRSEMWNLEQKHGHGDSEIYTVMSRHKNWLLMHRQSLQKSAHPWPCWILWCICQLAQWCRTLLH